MKKNETIPNQIAGTLINLNVKDFIHNNALPYAHYTIMDRALINRDGLKPVNRRLLYALYTQGAKNGKTIKAATIAGYTIGNLHPHGSSSVESALARTGQRFSLRIPLIDVQGSVGYFTGDEPAAPRYWEASLSKAGLELVKEVDDNVVQMKRNFADSLDEPVNLPIRWPVGIINGTQGIAVGYASDIPTHNPDEVMNCCIARLEDKVQDLNSLMKYIKGPDFSTGGKIIGIDGIRDYLETGKGTFIIRGKYRIEDLQRGQHNIIFYELPYQVSAEKIIERIKFLQQKGKLKDISEVKDLSDRKRGVYLSIKTKSGANPYAVANELFKTTPCETKFSVNMTVLLDNHPKKVGMISLIDQFLDFRKECFAKGLQNKIEKLRIDSLRLDGILAILTNVDKAIEIIKNSEDVSSASKTLISEFVINEEQADYILQMKLRSLTKADKNEIINKNDLIKSDLKISIEILENQEKFKKALIEDLKTTQKIISNERLTEIEEITHDELHQQEKDNRKLNKLLSKNIKCSIKIFYDNTFIKTIGEDIQIDKPIKEIIECTSQGKVYLLSNNGEIVEYEVANIPLNKLSNISLLGIKSSHFVCMFDEEQTGAFIVSNFGNVITVKPKFKQGSMVTLVPGEYIIYGTGVNQEMIDKKLILMLNEDGIVTCFSLNQVRIVSQGAGLISGGKAGNYVSATLSGEDERIVTIGTHTIKTTSIEDVPVLNRSSKGSLLHKPIEKEKMLKITFASKILDKDNKEISLPSFSYRAQKGMKFDTKNIILGD